MKKTVAVFIVLFVIAMGVMVGWGFIDKQLRQSQSPPLPQNNSSENTATGTTTSQTANNPTSSVQTTVYSLWDLSGHKTQNDCWIAVNGNVYDVTKYLDFHPGGADLILMQCGKDATQAFNSQGGRGGGHSSKAKSLLAQYQIGVLK